MPALHVIIAPDALADLEGIREHVARPAGATIASDFTAEILDAVDRLAEMPGMGHRRADVRHPSYHFWSVIAYRADVQAVRVARVVHRHRGACQLVAGPPLAVAGGASSSAVPA